MYGNLYTKNSVCIIITISKLNSDHITQNIEIITYSSYKSTSFNSCYIFLILFTARY